MNENTIKALEFDKILEKLSSYAKTSQSKYLCKNLEISEDTSKIKEQLQYTKEAKKILDCSMEIPIEFIAKIDDIKNSTIGSYLKEEEIVDIAKTIKSSRLVKNFIRENTNKDSILLNLSELLYSNKELENKIFETFDSNLNVKSDASAELSRLNNALKDSENNLKQ